MKESREAFSSMLFMDSFRFDLIRERTFMYEFKWGVSEVNKPIEKLQKGEIMSQLHPTLLPFTPPIAHNFLPTNDWTMFLVKKSWENQIEKLLQPQQQQLHSLPFSPSFHQIVNVQCVLVFPSFLLQHNKGLFIISLAKHRILNC